MWKKAHNRRYKVAAVLLANRINAASSNTLIHSPSLINVDKSIPDTNIKKWTKQSKVDTLTIDVSS